MTLRIGHVVVQITSFCNIDCSYCYLPDRNNRARIEPSIVRQLAARVAEYQDASSPLTWNWHAGEPLTVGLDHFRACHAAVAEGAPNTAQNFQYHVQTNGILIDDAWAAFFKQHEYKVGVSLDGPADIHNKNRVTRNGQGTFDKTVAGIKRLQDVGLNPGALAVVGAAALERPLEFLYAFTDLGIKSVAFNFEEIEGPHIQSSLKGLDDQELLRSKVHRFISEILRERDRQFPDIELRETDRLMPSILSGNAVEAPLTHPMTYVTVLTDGEVSSFCPELAGVGRTHKIDFPVGNITNESFTTIAERLVESRAYADIQAGVDHCRTTCDYFTLCGGGCPSNKFFETGSFASTETMNCRTRNQFVTDAVLDYIIATDLDDQGNPTTILPR